MISLSDRRTPASTYSSIALPIRLSPPLLSSQTGTPETLIPASIEGHCPDWLSPALQRLWEHILRAPYPFPLLISSPSPIESSQLIRSVGKKLLCLDPHREYPFPCQTCIACRAFEGHRHPAALFHNFSSAGEGSTERIRDLYAQLTIPSGTPSGYYIVTITQLESYGIFARQALLKLIEEPPTPTYFLLSTAHPFMVEETLLSRCQRFQIHPASRTALSTWLTQEAYPNRQAVHHAVQIASGSPLETLRQLELNLCNRRAAFIRQICQAIAHQNLLSLSSVFINPKEHLQDKLLWYTHFCADLCKFSTGWIQDLTYPECQIFFQSFFNRKPSIVFEKLLKVWTTATQTYSNYKQYPALNPNLLVADLLYRQYHCLGI